MALRDRSRTNTTNGQKKRLTPRPNRPTGLKTNTQLITPGDGGRQIHHEILFRATPNPSASRFATTPQRVKVPPGFIEGSPQLHKPENNLLFALGPSTKSFAGPANNSTSPGIPTPCTFIGKRRTPSLATSAEQQKQWAEIDEDD